MKNYINNQCCYFFIKDNNKINYFNYNHHKFLTKKIKLFFYCLIVFLYNLLYLKKFKLDKIKVPKKSNLKGNIKDINKIHKNITYEYLNKAFVNKFNSFIKVCLNDSLIDNKMYPLLKNPKISVIIPIFNGGKYLYYSLRSIQNQKMKEIEIILIDDYSSDNTVEIIQKYMEKDQRIRLIKNKINRKILYSKSIGALNSKGKYIIQLDQDDLFIRDDVFDLLYNEAENSSLDLVQISDIVRNQILFDNLTRINCMIPLKNESYITQPELKYTLFTNDYNYLLWCLLIKGDIYKKAIYGLWPVIINYQIKFQEDYIITFMIVILSKNYKYLNYISLIHLFHSNSTSANFIRKNEYHLSLLFCGYIIYDYYIKYNPKDIIILFNYLNFFSKDFKTSKIRFPKLFKHILNIILKSKFLSDKYKIFLKKEFQISDLKHNNSKIIPKLKCINNSTFFNKKVEKNDNKIIFSIIIVCTEYQYLENIIDSIQIQSFIYFEIILIYDNNDIINLNLIKNYIKKYQNIKLISNEEIQGFVYSFSKGIETSKGEYIWLLRPNYILSGKEILSKLYNIVKKDKSIDILEFNLLINDEIVDNNSLNIYKCHHFKSEFNFDGIKYNMNYSEIDLKEDLLINKLIKSNLFKKIINKFNLTNINRKIFNYYNSIFLFAIESEKNIFKSSDIIGVIQKNEDILNNNYYIINNKNQRIQDSIFFINFLFENANNTTKDKEFVLNKFFNIMSIVFNKFNRLSDESLLLYEKFIKCKYISLINKNILKFYYKSLIN